MPVEVQIKKQLLWKFSNDCRFENASIWNYKRCHGDDRYPYFGIYVTKLANGTDFAVTRLFMKSIMSA